MGRGLTLWGNSQTLESQQIVEQKNRKTVAALDSSTCPLGETELGTLYVARLALVTREGDSLTCSIIGPVMVLVTADLVRSHLRVASDSLVKKFVTDTTAGGRFVRCALEKLGVRMALQQICGGILLYDGPLDLLQNLPRLGAVRDYLSDAVAECNLLLGVCKSSKLKEVVDVQESLYLRGGPPCFSIVGSVCHDEVLLTVAKLSRGAIPLRIDIPRSVSPYDALGELLYNDRMHEGYPETLYLAHHMAIFSRLEISELKQRVLSRFGMAERRTVNARRIFLG